jgi:hypothetical protein
VNNLTFVDEDLGLDFPPRTQWVAQCHLSFSVTTPLPHHFTMPLQNSPYKAAQPRKKTNVPPVPLGGRSSTFHSGVTPSPRTASNPLGTSSSGYASAGTVTRSVSSLSHASVRSSRKESVADASIIDSNNCDDIIDVDSEDDEMLGFHTSEWPIEKTLCINRNAPIHR